MSLYLPKALSHNLLQETEILKVSLNHCELLSKSLIVHLNLNHTLLLPFQNTLNHRSHLLVHHDCMKKLIMVTASMARVKNP